MARLRSSGFKLQWSAKSFQFSRISCTFGRQSTPERIVLLGKIEARWLNGFKKKTNLNEFKLSGFGYGLESQISKGVLAPSSFFILLTPFTAFHWANPTGQQQLHMWTEWHSQLPCFDTTPVLSEYSLAAIAAMQKTEELKE